MLFFLEIALPERLAGIFPIIRERAGPAPPICFFFLNLQNFIRMIETGFQSPEASVRIHPTAVVDPGVEIGAGTAVWHFSHLMEGCKIGAGCRIGQNVVVSPGVVLGDHVKVQNNVSLYTGVVCEDDVFLGPSCVFTNVINPRSAVPRKDQYRATVVKKGASIGANATIVCGHTIGRYAMIGAGAVVTRDVPDYALVTGNPARLSGWVSEYGHKLHFDALGMAVCPETGQRYKRENSSVIRVS